MKKEQAMMTLQGMADHRFTSVSLSTNVFLGEIFFSLNIQCTSKYQTQREIRYTKF